MSLHCLEGEEIVNLFVDAELESSKQPALFNHLADCQSCRCLLDSAMLFRRQIRTERNAVPPDVDAGFMLLLEKKRQENELENASHERRPVWRRNLYISRGSAALLAVLLIAIGFTLPRVPAIQQESPLIIGHQEYVDLNRLGGAEQSLSEQVFVFYPGVTVEVERE